LQHNRPIADITAVPPRLILAEQVSCPLRAWEKLAGRFSQRIRQADHNRLRSLAWSLSAQFPSCLPPERAHSRVCCSVFYWPG